MPSKTTIVGCLLLSSLILGIQSFSWKHPKNPANQLLLEREIPGLTTVTGRLEPVNIKGATLGRVFGALRVLTSDGRELTLRCATPGPQTSCFSHVPDGAVAQNRSYQIGYAQFQGTSVKGANVLLHLVDDRGRELLSPHKIVEMVKSGPNGPGNFFLTGSLVLLVAAAGVLLFGGRPEASKPPASWTDNHFPPSP